MQEEWLRIKDAMPTPEILLCIDNTSYLASSTILDESIGKTFTQNRKNIRRFWVSSPLSKHHFK